MSRRQVSIIQQLLSGVSPGARVLIAVSGGKDSIVLLDVVARCARRLKLKVEVAHVNHNLRQESVADAEFVGNIAKNYHMQFHLKSLHPPDAGVNIEAWGRVERYRYFSSVLEQQSLDWTLTAHTANDVAETLLMRLCANKETGNITPSDSRRKVLRPLLRATRAQIDEYVIAHELQWREDASNSDTSYTRNLFRHKVIPVLESELGSSVIRSIAERGLVLGEDDRYLEAEGARIAADIGGVRFGDPAWVTHAGAKLSLVPSPLRWRAVESIFLPQVGYPIGSRRATLMFQLMLEGRGQLDLGEGCIVYASSKGLSLSYK